MVLFKRKAVFFLTKPAVQDDAEEIWVIPQTGEIFTSYESYLQRMDWYKLKRFTCEVSGRSGLSFFDALRSETAGSREVDEAFPDALKGPVLKRVQFSTTSRIDNLVDEVFDDFKSDFYPGEIVTVSIDDSQRLSGRVRDKAKFAEQRDPQTGKVTREAYSRYFVRLIDRPDEEALADAEHLARDRKIFTKQMLRSFIKNCVTREAWTGAPWLVKAELAERHNIDSVVPEHLRHSYKIAERKAARKSEQQQAQGLSLGYTQQQLDAMHPPNGAEYYGARPDPRWAQNSWHHANGLNYPYPGPPPPMPPGNQVPYYINNAHPPPYQTAHMPAQMEPPRPAAPVQKYPTEDMEVPPNNDDVYRPSLKFVATSQCNSDDNTDGVIEGIEEKTVGDLLGSWNTLNVYSNVLKLDNFTFDDFIEAIQFSSDEVDCDLLIETHCAVLKQLVYAENYQNGSIQISLPDLPDASDNEEEDTEEPETREPTPTPEPEVPARRTRSSLNKVQNAEPDEDTVMSDAETKMHRGAEIVDEYGWIQRLRKREFRNGGWEVVIAGLLHQLSGRERLRERCDQILAHLCPLDADPTIESISVQYSTMDINLRAAALQTIISLFLETKAVKDFMLDKAAEMTAIRNTKQKWQKERKTAMKTFAELDINRKLLAPTPENTPTPPPEDDVMDVDKVEDGDDTIADSEEEDSIQSRPGLRGGQHRLDERKRKREEEAKRKAAKEAEAKNKGSKEYQKVLKDIMKEREKIEDAEDQIMILDEQLRQADCNRTRLIGCDRFCNRYWWYERNAMPHAGANESSTADAQYANGRVWVQGPDESERQGYIDVSTEEQKNYSRQFGVTPAERKMKEEGSTHLEHANQWGFYDTPEAIDELIEWLDPRGNREFKLKKALGPLRDLIAQYMENRKKYLEPKEEDNEPEEPPRRMATRKKTYVSEPLARCTRWFNGMALEELGHKHVDPPPVKKGRGGRKGGSAGVAVTEVAKNRKGRGRSDSEAPAKRPSRQGESMDPGPARRSRRG